LKVVVGFLDRDPGAPAQVGADSRGELRMRVDPGANSRSSKRQVGEFLGGPSDSFQRSMYLAGIALEFLAEPDRRRVLRNASARS